MSNETSPSHEYKNYLAMAFWSSTQSLYRHKAVSEGMLILFDQGFLSIATFITGILLARSVSQEQFGLYILFWSFLNISLNFFEALINKPFVLNLPNTENKAQFFGSTMIHTLLLATIVIIVAELGLLFETSGPDELKINNSSLWAYTIPIILICFLGRHFLRGAALANLMVKSTIIPNITASITQISLLYSLFILNKLSVANAYFIISISALIACALLIYTLKERISIQAKCIVHDFKKNWEAGKWLLGNALAFTALSQASPWIILMILDASHVATYGVCMALSSAVAPLTRGMNAYILPRMTHGFRDGGDETLSRMVTISTFALSLPLLAWLIVCTIFADFFLETLYSSKYTGNTGLVFVLLLKNLIDISSNPVTNALQTIGKTKYTSLAQLMGIGLFVLSAYPLLLTYGILGAGIAASASSFFVAMIKWFWLIKLKKRL